MEVFSSPLGDVVIIGGGIIGLSTAFYLSAEISPSSICVFDASPQLFDCASGKAAGFLAKDWYTSRVMQNIGEISFAEHRKLADRFNGRVEWGYRGSRAINIVEDKTSGEADDQTRGDDWLWVGGSRREVASSPEDVELLKQDYPEWLKHKVTEKLSSEESTAQVDSFRLCRFLLETCRSRGVRFEYPAKVQEVVYEEGHISGVKWSSPPGTVQSMSCTHILLTAGAWTPSVLRELFPSSKFNIPISGLAGWSAIFRPKVSYSRDHTDKNTRNILGDSSTCIGAFTTSATEGFSPEFFTRMGSSASTNSPDGQELEVWFGGLNSSSLPLPDPSVPAFTPDVQDPQIQTLLRTAKSLFSANIYTEPDSPNPSGNRGAQDLELIQMNLYIRPATLNGTPILARIPSHMYLGHEAMQGYQREIGGLYICSGHGPWGISLSLGSGLVMSELMLKGDAEGKWKDLGV